MSPPNEAAQRSPVERAEELLDRFGQRLSEARARRTSQGEHAASPEQAQGQPVERAGEQVGLFIGGATREIRKAVARAREEAADLWAEAQHRVETQSIHQNNRDGGERTPTSANGGSSDT